MALHSALAALSVQAQSERQREVVLEDNFADGDITRDPLWEGGDLHWFNPFFVEKIGDQFWAGSTRYGSMGSNFTRPAQRDWPIALDAERGSVEVSFLTIFRPEFTNDALISALIGADSKVTVRVAMNGQVIISVVPLRPSPIKPWRKMVRGARQPGGVPLAIRYRVSPDEIRLWVNEQLQLEVDSSTLAPLEPLLTHFHRLAFIGAMRTIEPDIELLIPELQDTRALRWLGKIRVTGMPEEIKPDPIELAPDAHQRTLILCDGPFSLPYWETLRQQIGNDTVDVVYGAQPLRGKRLAEMRDAVTAERLSRYGRVIYIDPQLRQVGARGAAQLASYVQAGGRLTLVLGMIDPERSGLFDSPLAHLLPIMPANKINKPSMNAAAPPWTSPDRTRWLVKPEAAAIPDHRAGWSRQWGQGWIEVIEAHTASSNLQLDED